jgi:hypothetical protein
MIIKLIQERLGGEKAEEANRELPDQVDPDQHKDLLSKFGIDPQELLGGGGLGALGGKLGL